MSSFIEIIQKCLSPNNTIRIEGESEIQEKSNINLYESLTECTNIMTDDNGKKEIRQFCATYIRYIFKNENYLKQWELFPEENKLMIKQKILACLASSIPEIRNSTSIAISSICKYELPKNRWNEIIDILNNTSRNNNINYRLASLNTIYHIIIDLDYNELKQCHINTFLSAIFENFDLNNLIVFHQSIKAFYYILPFAKNNFEQEKERKYIIDKITGFLNINNNYNLTKEIKVILLQCLIEIIRLYIRNVYDEFNQIANITFQYMKMKEIELVNQAFEFWCSLTDFEINYNTNEISSKYQDTLFQYICYILSNRNKEEEDLYNDEWTPIKAVSVLISSLSELKNINFCNQMLNYIGTLLNNDNYLLKDSAYIAFNGILKNPFLDKEIIISSMNKMFEELKNPQLNNIVAITMSKCLVIITDIKNFLFEDEKLFDDMINNIMFVIEYRNTNRKLITLLLDCLNNLIRKLKNAKFLFKHCKNLLEKLIKLAYIRKAYNPNSNIALSSFFVIGTILEHSDIECKNIINSFFSEIYNLLHNSLNENNFTSKEEQLQYQSYICTIISSSCSGEKIQMNNEQLTLTYNLIIETFNQRNCIYEEGLMAMSSLANSNSEDYINLMDQSSKYIIQALNDIECYSLCKQGISSFSELIRSLNVKYINNIKKILPYIYNILTDCNSDKNLKIYSFYALTDIFGLESGEVYNEYRKIMELILPAINIAMIEPNKNEDIDNLNYFISLRERILEFFTVLFHYLEFYQKKNEFEIYVPGIIKFICTICLDKYLPNMEICSQSLGLITDLLISYPDIVKINVNRDIVKNICEKIQENGNENDKNILDWSKDYLIDYNIV